MFKQIFADSSESESEDEIKEPIKSTATNEHKNKSKLSLTGEVEKAKTTSQPNSDAKVSKILYEKRFSRDQNSKIETAREEDKKNKGIFDNLDLTKLTSKQNTTSGSVIRDKEQLVAKSSEDKESDEEGSLLYGPKPPIKPPIHAPVYTRPKSTFTPSQLSTLSITQVQQLSSLSFQTSSKSTTTKPKEEEVIWVEKEVVPHSSSKSKKHSTKKSKKSKSKRAKGKNKEKHKNKKRKSTTASKRKTSSGHLDSPSSSSDEDSDDSSSSVEIQSSLNQKALLASLKNIARSH